MRLRAHSAEYWDSPGGRLVTVISLVKAKVSGEAYDGGENATVDLWRGCPDATTPPDP